MHGETVKLVDMLWKSQTFPQ